ncbi:hypothetical protein ZWY2020_006474 [Hordeum vulgare]|nr:hypothetical protein ZWY2020_006474 [Hordeum vulgare]
MAACIDRPFLQADQSLEKVDYPLELDVYEFYSDELKLKLQTPRQEEEDYYGDTGPPSPSSRSYADEREEQHRLQHRRFLQHRGAQIPSPWVG